MARMTIASARLHIALLEEQNAQLKAALSAKPVVPPKNACKVFVNGKHRISAINASNAYALMMKCKEHGLRAMYRPYAA